MLDNNELAYNIYNGNLGAAYQSLLQKNITSFSDLSFNTSYITRQTEATYVMGLVPLIIKSEADHPGHFTNYRKLLSLVVQHDGAQKVLEKWTDPEGYRKEEWVDGLGDTVEFLDVPISRAMKAYYNCLKVRHTPLRENTNAMIHEIGVMAQGKSAAEKQAAFQTQCTLVEVYHRLNKRASR